jgi:hypothetical protein
MSGLNRAENTAAANTSKYSSSVRGDRFSKGYQHGVPPIPRSFPRSDGRNVAGSVIFWKQVLRASHADRIKRERCGCIALRSVPAINDLLPSDS